MNIKKLICVLFMFLVFAGVTNAQTTWYVNGAIGLSTNDGTQATNTAGNVGPLNTIQALLDKSYVVDGDIISVAANIYNETVTVTKKVTILATGGDITIKNLTLNYTGAAGTIGDASGNKVIVSGTLLLTNGNWTNSTSSLQLASSAKLQITKGTFNAVPTANGGAGTYDLIFSNTAALSTSATTLPAVDPLDITFQGSATVTLTAALRGRGNVTIASGSVYLNTFDLTVDDSFVNNGGYTTNAAGGGAVVLSGAGTTNALSGTGTFQHLTVNGAMTLVGPITFANVSSIVNSVLTVTAGLDLDAYNVTTPGNIIVSGGGAFTTTDGSGAIVMNGAVSQDFTVPDSGAPLIENLTINKPTGSILNFKTPTNTLLTKSVFTFGTNFNFISGQLESNFNDIVIGATHGLNANIGGPINRNSGSNGTFSLVNTTNGVTFGGTGQINIPVINSSTGMTNQFTLLTAIGSDLTVTDGILKTASLTLVNGNISVYTGGTLTMNGSNVSVTGNMSVGNVANTLGIITGTSNVTVSGAVAFVGTNAGSKIDLTTAGSTPAGNLTVTGSLTDAAASQLLRVNNLSVGTFVNGFNSTVTTLGTFTVGAGGITTGAGTYTINGAFQSTGAVALGANAKAFKNTFTALGAVTTGAGNVTVTGTANITGLLTMDTGAVWFKGAATLTGGSTTTAGASLRIDGTGTIGAAMTDNGNATTYVFNGNTTITGNFTTTAASTITFGSSGTSGILNSTIDGILNMTAPGAGALTISTTDADDYHNLAIKKAFTTTASNNLGAVVLGNSSTLTFNGSAAQTITIASALTIAGTGKVEFANTINTNQGARDASVQVATSTLTIPNIILTTGGVKNTNITLGATGTITVVGGYFSTGAPALTGGSYNLTFKNNNAWPLSVSGTTPTAYELQAGIINLTLTTGYTGTVTLPAASNPIIAGILSVTSGRTLALGANTLTVAKTTTGTNINVAGTVSGTGKVALTVPAAAVTIAGAGSMVNLDINYGANDQVVTLAGPATLSGNLATTGGGNGTLTFGSTAFSNVGGTTTFNNKAINLPTVGLTCTGSFTHTAGIIYFPTGNGSLNLLAAANTIGGGLTYDFTTNSNAFGRLNLMGTVAQTLTLGGPQTVARVNINNAAGVTIQAFALTATDLYLTNGLLTHNGLLSTTSITRKITDATNGQLATQPASGPLNVTYVGTANGSTGPELLGVLTNLTMNSDIGYNPTITLASGTTIVTGGTLTLSRGTLAGGTNITFAPGTETIIRADGTLTGTPVFGGTVNLQYLNSTAITTGTEWSSPTAIGTVLINCLGTSVALGQNSTATGLVTVSFGTLDLGAYSLTLKEGVNGITNNATVTASGAGYLNFGATALLNGTAASYPKMVVNATGATLTLGAVAAPNTVTINGDLVLTKGSFSIGAATTMVVKGNIDVQTTANTFNANAKTVKLWGNFSIVGDDATPAGTPLISQDVSTLQFVGTAAQTITTRDNAATGYLNNVTINNTNGVTLLTNVVIGNAKTLTLTEGNLNTGANALQVGVTAAGIIATPSATSYIIGNLYRYAKADYTVADAAGKYVFPMGTIDGKYRPVTIAFPSAATAGTGTAHIIKAYHTNAPVTATVGIPFTNGGVTINKLAPLYWTVGMYDATAPTTFLQPASTATASDYPTVTLGAGGVTFGDLTLTRAVYRLTNDLNTWTMPGTPGVPYYDVNGVATIVHSGVQGWTTEPQELFAIGYGSTFVVANPLTAQSLVVGDAPYTKNVTTAPAVFSGNQGTLTYSVVSSDPTKATATIVSGLLTVTPLVEGTTTVTVTATDVNGEQKTSAFVVTVNAKPTFTLPAAATFAIAEGATTANTVVFEATGTAGITFAMVPNTPALTWAAFDATTKTLTLTPTYGVAGAVPGGIYTITIRATGTNGLTKDFVLTVTVSTTLRNPSWTAEGSATLPTKTIKYNETLTFNYKAIDPDAAHTLTYSLDSITPATPAAVVAADGKLTFTPTAANSGVEYTIVVKALCSSGLFSTTQTVLTVGVNHAPTFVAPTLTDKTIPVNNVYLPFTFQFVGEDVDGDAFTYTLISGKGNITATGLYSWNPVSADLGTTNTIKVRITDAANPLIFSETSAVLTCESVITGIDGSEIPTTYGMSQNYPNPFNPTTVISYSLPKESMVTVKVINMIGQEIATLVNEVKSAGAHKVNFNANGLTSGTYIAIIKAGSFTKTIKMSLLK
jgi:hypothetical protein